MSLSKFGPFSLLRMLRDSGKEEAPPVHLRKDSNAQMGLEPERVGEEGGS